MESNVSTTKKAISIYVAPKLFAQIEAAAKDDGRSVSGWLEHTLTNYMTHPQPAKLEVRRDGQMHIEDAIAAAVKRGPVRVSKHK